LLNISTLQGKMGDGDISLPGMLDVRRDNSAPSSSRGWITLRLAPS
jgi:hypothetical protein